MKRLGVAVSVLVVALVASLTVRLVVIDDRDPLVVVHWSNNHPMRDGLLPAMAERFNDADHETASGRPIEIHLVKCDSSDQVDDLVARTAGAARDAGCDEDDEPAPDPTIVTTQSDDWLIDANHLAGTEVIDLDNTLSIAETYLGIVTYRAMAECLGWPDQKVGYEDLVALFENPEGWRAYPDCDWDPKWGTEPLLAFTNPSTSTSGRNVLVSLYAMATGKAPADLTLPDVERADVLESVRSFQQLVDHYMPGTIPLNTKIAQGPSAGHFFLMPEDNLVSLYQGNEQYIAPDGTEQKVPPVKDLVMMYPEEGSVLNSNPAAVVNAAWVSDDEEAAAREWIEFLREDDQQERFVDAGFRPASGTGLSVNAEEFARWGLDADQPASTIEPGDLAPDVLAQIIGSWGAVKKPSIVTFVVDVSGSMEGDPLADVQEGMDRVVYTMSGPDSAGTDNQVGLVTFSSKVEAEIPPAPLKKSKYDITRTVENMTATGETALYDAIARAVELTDAAPGDPSSTRAVVVLSDGAANKGSTRLDELVSMRSDDEIPILSYKGMRDDLDEAEGQPVDARDRTVPVEEVNGSALLLPHEHEVQIFFLGFGGSDIQVGRILAEATGAEYQGQTDEDLAALIEALSGYF